MLVLVPDFNALVGAWHKPVLTSSDTFVCFSKCPQMVGAMLKQ